MLHMYGVLPSKYYCIATVHFCETSITGTSNFRFSFCLSNLYSNQITKKPFKIVLSYNFCLHRYELYRVQEGLFYIVHLYPLRVELELWEDSYLEITVLTIVVTYTALLSHKTASCMTRYNHELD